MTVRRASRRVIPVRRPYLHARPPVNLFAFEWKGFTSLYIPPQTAPDLTELRILQELPSYPEED